VASDWSFARRPFWLFSHVFAASIVVLFVFLGLWQLDRHHERAAFNDRVSGRTLAPALALADVVEAQPPAELDFQLVQGSGSYVDAEFVRVANRSQGGVGGQHLVALFRLDDGRHLLINRGFVPLGESVLVDPVPDGTVQVEGWLRQSVEKESFGATDTGQGDLVPRLDIAAIGQRLDEAVVPVWLQLAPRTAAAVGEPGSGFPDPVPLPPFDGGPHLGYMGQWFIFAVLGIGFYLAVLRRQSRAVAQGEESHDDATMEQIAAV